MVEAARYRIEAVVGHCKIVAAVDHCRSHGLPIVVHHGVVQARNHRALDTAARRNLDHLRRSRDVDVAAPHSVDHRSHRHRRRRLHIYRDPDTFVRRNVDRRSHRRNRHRRRRSLSGNAETS